MSCVRHARAGLCGLRSRLLRARLRLLYLRWRRESFSGGARKEARLKTAPFTFFLKRRRKTAERSGNELCAPCACRAARAAFTLVESVLAIALFAMAAFFITLSCYNFVWPLDVKDKPSEYENLIDRAVEAITSVSDYDSLDDGVEIETFDGDICHVYGEAFPTQIIDLFELRMRLSAGGKDYVKTLWVMRPNWYQYSSERDDLVRDRTDYLEDLRRKEDRKK